MTKEELKEKLDELEIPYHHLAGEKKLKKLLKEATEPTEVIEEVNNVEKPKNKVEQIVFNQPNYRQAWHELNALLKEVKSKKWDYLIVTDGSFTFPFEEPYDAVKQLKSMDADCLSLYKLPFSDGQWTGKKPKAIEGGYISYWVDNNFIASREFFESFDFTVSKAPSNWNKNNKSNGIGGQLSIKAVKKGLKLCHL